MPPTGWDRMARWRDRRMGERGDLWHRAIIDPAVERLIGPVRGLDVLEIACGNGYLARRLARRGARRVVAVDRSAATVALARRRDRGRPSRVVYEVADAAHLPGLASATFDLAVANMALMDIADADGTLREVGRLLRPGGRFVFSISHPCFDLDDHSVWSVERGLSATGGYTTTVARKVWGYRREERRLVPWDVARGGVVRTESFHRTLSTYVRLLGAGGLLVRRLEEPRPRPEAVRKSPQGPYLLEIPLHLVVEAVRGLPSRRASRRSAGSPRAGARRSGSARRRPRTGSRRSGSTPGS